jgi:hypothetical protein
MDEEEKTKEERIKESIAILKKLKGLGIPHTNIGYINTKAVLDTWIATGEECNDEIYFRVYGRIGCIHLPKWKGSVATYRLKATEELKEYVKENAI